MIEGCPSPVEKWEAYFVQEPLEAVDRLLTRRTYMGRLNRNDTDEILFRLFRTATKDRLITLDKALQSWFMNCLEVAPPSFEPVRWIEILQDAFSVVARLDLPKTQSWLQDNHVQARLWLRSLSLDSARDPEADLLRTLALCQRDLGLLPLWMRLCGLEEDRPLHFASIGLLGLCKLPKEDGERHGDLHPAVFSGIVDLASAVSRQVRPETDGRRFWLSEVRALMARYPRSSRYWADNFVPLIVSAPASTAADWLCNLIPRIDQELRGGRRRFTSSRHAQPVPRYEYEAILKLLKTQPLEEIRPRLTQFLEKHRVYARHTGCSEDLVRILSSVGYRIYRQDGNWALTLIEEGFHWSPYDPYLWTTRATVESYLHRNALAVGILWEAKRMFPEDAHTRTILAGLLAQEDKAEVAEMVYRQAIDDFPGNVYCRTGLAELLRMQGRLVDAEGEYRQAIDDFPGNVYCRTGLAELLRMQGRLVDAEGEYRQAIDDFPNDAVCRTGLAEVLRMQGRLVDAEGEYRQALDDFPNNAYCSSGLAEVLKEQGKLAHEEQDLPRAQSKFGEAEQLYVQAAKRFPGNVVCRTGLGGVLRVQAKLTEAGRVYRQAMLDFPDNPVSYLGLAIVLLRQGSQEDAVSLLERTVEQFPRNLIVARFLQQVKGGSEDPNAIEVSYDEFSAAVSKTARSALCDRVSIDKEAGLPYEAFSVGTAEGEKISLAREAFIETEPEPNGVMKKGKKSESHSSSEAKRPTTLTPNGVFQHPANTTASPFRGGDTSEAEIALASLYRFAARRAIGEEQARYRQYSAQACEKALSQNPNSIFALLEKGFGLLDQEPQAAAAFFEEHATNRKWSNVLGFRIGSLRAEIHGGKSITAQQWRELMNGFKSRRTIIALEHARLELGFYRNGNTLSTLEYLRKQLLVDIKTLPKSLRDNEDWVRSVVAQRLFAEIDLAYSLTEDNVPQLHDNYEQHSFVLQGVTEQTLTSSI